MKLSGFANIVLLVLATLLAGFCAAMIFYLYINSKKNKQQKDLLKKSAGAQNNLYSEMFCCDGFAKKILLFMLKDSYKIKFVSGSSKYIKKFVKTSKLPKRICRLKDMSGIPSNFDNYSYREIQLKLCILFCSAGLVFGVMFSYYLMFILFFVCLILGLLAQSWAMKKEIDERCNQLEKNLPEMLEVVALGLRSGLTFDRSLKIYSQHFENEFSKSCRQAQRKWEGGVSSRDDALRKLANSYNSALFKRVVENVIRSLRFGASLVESLEDASVEARNVYKSKQEEIVAKAPVKMMIPTGTLILPAMLIFVLGPILLELVNGF